MRASQFFIATQKEAPSDAELISHKLMVRAGLIKKLGTAKFGNWSDTPAETSRYDRTRLVAERSGLWNRALLRTLMPEDFEIGVG